MYVSKQNVTHIFDKIIFLWTSHIVVLVPAEKHFVVMFYMDPFNTGVLPAGRKEVATNILI